MASTSGQTTYSPPEALFHYCSASAFFKILRRAKLWMGRLASMNDYMEQTWLRSMALRIVRESYAPYLIDFKLSPSMQRRMTFYRELERRLDGSSDADPYCMCFSADGDVLSQWRSYADGGQGFAIGFDPKALSYGSDLAPYQVGYNEGEQEAFVRKMLYGADLRLGETGVERDPDKVAHDVHHAVSTLAMFSKNPKFVEEQEYRVVHDMVDDPVPDYFADMGPLFRRLHVKGVELHPRYVVRRGRLHRFLEAPFDPSRGKDSVLKVVTGPRNPAQSDRSVLRGFLDRYGYKHVEIVSSMATLR